MKASILTVKTGILTVKVSIPGMKASFPGVKVSIPTVKGGIPGVKTGIRVNLVQSGVSNGLQNGPTDATQVSTAKGLGRVLYTVDPPGLSRRY